MVEQNVIEYYVAHLEWLLALSKAVHKEQVRKISFNRCYTMYFWKMA